jgi:hypothetical protein
MAEPRGKDCAAAAHRRNTDFMADRKFPFEWRVDLPGNSILEKHFHAVFLVGWPDDTIEKLGFVGRRQDAHKGISAFIPIGIPKLASAL